MIERQKKLNKIQESIKDAMQKYAIKLKYEIPPRKNEAANSKQNNEKMQEQKK